MQLNASGRLPKYMGEPEKVACVNNFIYANFNYCSLAWHFSTCESIRKNQKIKKRCLRIVVDDYGSDHDVLLNGKKWKSDNGNKAIKSSGLREADLGLLQHSRWSTLF